MLSLKLCPELSAPESHPEPRTLCFFQSSQSVMRPEALSESMTTNGRMTRVKETKPHTRAVRLHEKDHLPPNLDFR